MSELTEKAAAARIAAKKLSVLSSADKNAALRSIADMLASHTMEILTANERDLEDGRASGMSDALLDRLALSEKRISEIVEGVRQVIELPDPIGEVIESFTLPSGVEAQKLRVPMGVIGMIYEARPNVTVDAAVLSLKAGSAIILRGSSSALSSNRELVRLMQQALEATDVSPHAIALFEAPGHAAVDEMLHLREYIDVLIPRGGAGLIRNVVSKASVPVIETGTGNCHIFIDASADFDMTREIVLNAKTQRPSVCNAAETLLVHKDWPHLPALLQDLSAAQVELFGCERTRAVAPQVNPAGDDDYAQEYLRLAMAVRVVDDLDKALLHIDRYGTHHTDAIITEDAYNAARFLSEVDSACVNHNASTRFTDGFQFGFGAEIGISTQKIHARGPLGLHEITSYKYVLRGTGQVRK